MTLPARILELCDTDDGSSRAELLALTGAKYTVLDTELRRMVLDGRLTQVKMTARNARYFTHAVDAASWHRKQRKIPTLDEQILKLMAAEPMARHTGRSLQPRVEGFCLDSVVAMLRQLHAACRIAKLTRGRSHGGYFLTAAARDRYAELTAPKRRRRAPVGTAATAAHARAAICRS